MSAFYFDVGGVLIPDQLAPANAPNVFRQLGQKHGFDPEAGHAAYTKLQPSLDLGAAPIEELCAAIGISVEAFERDWLAMHPVNEKVLGAIDGLAQRGYSVGLATNFCRHLLNRLIETSSRLHQLTVCCSSDLGVAKPSIDFFRRACEIIRSHDIVFVDDREVNIAAAEDFGWTAIHATGNWLTRFQTGYLRDCP